MNQALTIPRYILVQDFFEFVLKRFEETSTRMVNALSAKNPSRLSYLEDPDVQLILQYQQGNSQAFDQLFHKWKRPLISFLYRSVGNITEAEDLALEVFVKVHKSIDRYKPTAKFSSYLFFIGRRTALNHFRKHNRKPLEIVDPSDLGIINKHSAEDQRPLREMEEAFQKALLKLPELQRTALILLTQQQLQPQEIAKIIGKKPSATRVMIHRAREQLRIELENLS